MAGRKVLEVSDDAPFPELPSKPAARLIPGDFLYDDSRKGLMVLAVSCELARDQVDVSLSGSPPRQYRMRDRVTWLPGST